MKTKICSKITVCIHQLEHLPHLSLFKKFAKADIIVLGDTFQFKKNYYENRNKIRASNEQRWQWITVPVERENHKSINKVHIIYDGKWQRKYLGALKQNYSNSLYFNKYYPEIESCIMEKSGQTIYISDLNKILLKLCLKWLHIDTPIIMTSSLDLSSKLEGTDFLIEICQKIGADTYLSGPSGRDYLELEKFKKVNINVIFHEKEEGLSIIDYLFTGKNEL